MQQGSEPASGASSAPLDVQQQAALRRSQHTSCGDRRNQFFDVVKAQERARIRAERERERTDQNDERMRGNSLKRGRRVVWQRRVAAGRQFRSCHQSISTSVSQGLGTRSRRTGRTVTEFNKVLRPRSRVLGVRNVELVALAASTDYAHGSGTRRTRLRACERSMPLFGEIRTRGRTRRRVRKRIGSFPAHSLPEKCPVSAR